MSVHLLNPSRSSMIRSIMADIVDNVTEASSPPFLHANRRRHRRSYDVTPSIQVRSAIRIQRQQRAKAVQSAFVDELTCGVCFVTSYTVFRCARGHPICSQCLQSLVRSARIHHCPTCRSCSNAFFKDSATGRLATIAGVHAVCECGQAVSIAQLETHRATCTECMSRQCIIPGCSFSGSPAEVVEHLNHHITMGSVPNGWY